MLRQKNVFMDDLCLENMLYDSENKRINLIDTSRWFSKRDGQFESIGNFNWQMMSALLQSIDGPSPIPPLTIYTFPL